MRGFDETENFCYHIGMINNSSALLEDLTTVDWVAAANTYGNHHSTLIGLIVQWWIKKNPTKYLVLEGAPSVRYYNPVKEKNVRGHGDAMLCEGNAPLGIIEVEGTRFRETAAKIGGYFAAQEYETLQFGILLLYVTGARGRGIEKKYQSANNDNALAEVKESDERPAKQTNCSDCVRQRVDARNRVGFPQQVLWW